jgi:hypothetical protein
MSSKSMRNISKILIVFSFFLFSLASYIDIEHKRVVEQLEAASTETETEPISIDIPNDEPTTSEVVDDSKSKDDTVETSETKPSSTKSNTKKPNNNTVVSSGNTNSNKVVYTNDDIRRNIENKYKISIKYCSETDGYTVAGMSVNSITDTNQITKALNDLNSALATYPIGIYDEVTASFPLTIYLINKYSIANVTGVTDSTNRNVRMSIATSFPFNDSFHHETYHYLELYMKNRGMNYSSWANLNPSNFSYGSVDDSLSYSMTFSSSSYFVNNYAQSSEEEDRASTFEYMMATSKASCLNAGRPIYKKAKYMADTMDFFIDACSSNTTERWEKYL